MGGGVSLILKILKNPKLDGNNNNNNNKNRPTMLKTHSHAELVGLGQN
jgi:hypothetical protein